MSWSSRVRKKHNDLVAVDYVSTYQHPVLDLGGGRVLDVTDRSDKTWESEWASAVGGNMGSTRPGEAVAIMWP